MQAEAPAQSLSDEKDTAPPDDDSTHVENGQAGDKPGKNGTAPLGDVGEDDANPAGEKPIDGEDLSDARANVKDSPNEKEG